MISSRYVFDCLFDENTVITIVNTVNKHKAIVKIIYNNGLNVSIASGLNIQITAIKNTTGIKYA